MIVLTLIVSNHHTLHSITIAAHGYYPPPPPNDHPYYSGRQVPDYPPPQHYDYRGPPPPHHHPHAPHTYAPHHASPRGHHLSPRYGHHQYVEYDRPYATEPGNNAPPKPSQAAEDETYQSPTSVVNTLDTRSPEGSRNLNNFEERGAPPPPTNMMPYHYHPHHHHHQHQMHPPHASYHHYPPQPIHTPQPTPGSTGKQWWTCEQGCGHKFAQWEECSAHESICVARGNNGRNKNGKRTLPMMEHESRFIDPSEEFANNTDRETFKLASPHDGQSLSDRQCYVRSHFVELFVAKDSDVSSRHSRGAQKLNLNQVGMRCAYCAKLKPRDRAERAVCYPSSISRIYQTVADMQRFHFESCTAIPPSVLRVYKSLKTTRPRGMGSPQSYWDKSAREMGLIDSEKGIQLSPDSKVLSGKAFENERLDVVKTEPAPLPSLTNSSADESKDDEAAALPTVSPPKTSVVDNKVESIDAPATPSTKEDVKSQETHEADASILLMLKNPDSTNSPKSDNEAVAQV